MADITLFWCFWKNKILDRMMEFQVKFCYHSGLRLWRTGMLFSTKFKGHKSKFRISWMYRYHFYDLKVHFWWPNKRFFWCRSSSNTLYKWIKNYPKCHQTLRLLTWGSLNIKLVQNHILGNINSGPKLLVKDENSKFWITRMNCSVCIFFEENVLTYFSIFEW